ncbi:MAG: succinylglutamate desuccinylase/aspartoacylase family protein [Candidatus Bathyarchaeota archaeon]|nr:succinylglutamate desuccinylase/aspartoacylase family protein [Candidatus Bathyarchaeota archaeon]
MSEAFRVGERRVEPGSRGSGCLTLPDFFADGQGVEIPFMVVNGAKPGPCLYIQVAQHGSEVQGLDAVRRLLDGIDEERMAGALIYCLPNPLAFRESARVTMFDPLPGGMNRVWPGSPEGSPTERMAHAIWTELVGRADAAVDLHTGSRHAPVWVFYEAPGVSERASEETAERSYRMARLFGAPLLYMEAEAYGGRKTLRACCVDEGIPAIVPELGGASYFDEAIIALVARGLRNIMVDMSMIPGEVELPERQTVLKWTADPREAGVYADKGGVFLPAVGLGETVRKGDEVGVIYSPRNFKVVERLVAPQDGYVFSVRENPVANAGTRIMVIPEILEILANLQQA